MSAHTTKPRENKSSVGALTIAEVADELRCGESTVLRLIESKRLRGVRIGARKLIVLREDLARFLHDGEDGAA
jgi:excisionase family DNA binding protein